MPSPETSTPGTVHLLHEHRSHGHCLTCWLTVVTARLRSSETTARGGAGRGQHLPACLIAIRPHPTKKKNLAHGPHMQSSARRCLNSPINRGRPASAARADSAGPVPARSGTVPSARARPKRGDLGHGACGCAGRWERAVLPTAEPRLTRGPAGPRVASRP